MEGSQDFVQVGKPPNPMQVIQIGKLLEWHTVGYPFTGWQVLDDPVNCKIGWALETAMHGCGVAFLLFMSDCGPDLMSTLLELKE